MNRRLLSLTILISFVFTFVLGEYAIVFAQEDDHVRIAIVPFTNTNTFAREQGYGEVVSGMLMTELINNNIFQVVERNEIDRMMQEMAFQYSGAVNSQTAKRIGEILGVDILVFGTVAKFSFLIETDIRLVDAESGEALMAENASCKDETELRAMVKDLAQRINERFQQQFEETVNIYSDPYGAVITIDGNEKGVTPLTIKMSRGTHSITASMNGYVDWQQQVEIVSGENHIDVYLEKGTSVQKPAEQKSKKGSKMLLWVVGGAAVAAGTVFLLNSNKDDDTENNTTNSDVTIITTLP